MKQNFITGAEFSPAELVKIIEKAISIKKMASSARAKRKWPDHSGKILTLIFANPSLRTRLSFESGMKKMGGNVNVLDANSAWQFEYKDGVIMDGAKQEHIKEAARVISRYTDLIGLRSSELMTTASSHGSISGWDELRKDVPISQLAKYAEKPVINMESNMYHPCQGMADVMTMCEHFGNIKKKKYVLTWAPHPKALPLATPHSQALMPASFGMDVTVSHPEGFSLDDEVISLAQKKATETGGSFTISHNQTEAMKNADVIVAKSWASRKFFGDFEAESVYRKKFRGWTVTEDKMATTNNAMFMHCLPVRRNVVVTDAVLDSKNSFILQGAENRMWVQMAIIDYLFTLTP